MAQNHQNQEQYQQAQQAVQPTQANINPRNLQQAQAQESSGQKNSSLQQNEQKRYQ
jgi:hypothetical protein